jgi:hypothetical protein
MVAHERTEHSRWHMQEAFERPVEMAKEYPISSMLVLFGAGVGVGLIVSNLLCEQLMHHETMTERLGRQMKEYLQSTLPESLASRLPR